MDFMTDDEIDRFYVEEVKNADPNSFFRKALEERYGPYEKEKYRHLHKIDMYQELLQEGRIRLADVPKEYHPEQIATAAQKSNTRTHTNQNEFLPFSFWYMGKLLEPTEWPKQEGLFNKKLMMHLDTLDTVLEFLSWHTQLLGNLSSTQALNLFSFMFTSKGRDWEGEPPREDWSNAIAEGRQMFTTSLSQIFRGKAKLSMDEIDTVVDDRFVETLAMTQLWHGLTSGASLKQELRIKAENGTHQKRASQLGLQIKDVFNFNYPPYLNIPSTLDESVEEARAIFNEYSREFGPIPEAPQILHDYLARVNNS